MRANVTAVHSCQADRIAFAVVYRLVNKDGLAIGFYGKVVFCPRIGAGVLVAVPVGDEILTVFVGGELRLHTAGSLNIFGKAVILGKCDGKAETQRQLVQCMQNRNNVQWWGKFIHLILAIALGVCDKDQCRRSNAVDGG